MSFVKLFLLLVLVCVFLFFALLNYDQKVEVRLWLGDAPTYENVPLSIAVLVGFLAGIITYFFIALTRDIKFRATIGRLKRDNRTLQSELHHLRGSALDDLPTDESIETVGREGQQS